MRRADERSVYQTLASFPINLAKLMFAQLQDDTFCTPKLFELKKIDKLNESMKTPGGLERG